MAILIKRFWYLPLLFLYAALVAFMIVHHEPWFDEAQGWLIARDCTLSDLFSGVLRYECHPILWYLILKLALFFHLPYEAIGIVGGVIATIGIAVLLAKSPFPKWLAALLPFTFFLCYQYAVITRSYVLLPLLLFVVAAMHRRRWEYPIWWSVLMLLLANLSIHAFVIAGGIMLIHVVELLLRWVTLTSQAKRRQIFGVVMYALGSLGVLVMLWPAKDFGGATWLNGVFTFKTTWNATMVAIDDAFFGQPILTALFLAVSCYWFWRTRTLHLFLLPWLAVIVVFLALRLNEHHYGILFVVWLFAFWCSIDSYRDVPDRESGGFPIRKAYQIMLLCAACLVVRQVVWTGYSAVNEYRRPYCGAAAAAQYIKANQLTNYRIGGIRYKITSLLPYFDKNIFVDFPNEQGKCFVEWRKSCYVGNDVFNAANCLTEPCNVLVWSIETNLPSVPWTDPNFLGNFAKNWQCVAYFDGQQVFEDQLPCHFGIAILTTKKLADKLALPNKTCLAGRKDEKVQPLANQSGDLTMWGGSYLVLGGILRRIDPQSSMSFFQNVIELPLPKIDNRNPSAEAGIQALFLLELQANAQNNLGVLMAAKNPEQALGHFAAAVQINPNNPDFVMNLASFLAKQKRIPEAITILRKYMDRRPNMRVEGLLRNMVESLDATNTPHSDEKSNAKPMHTEKSK